MPSWQPSLLSAARATPFAWETAQRIDLDVRSWVDLVPSWFPEADGTFEALRTGVTWCAGQRPMYGNLVDEPRLTGRWQPRRLPPDVADRIEAARAALAERFGVAFDLTWLNHYRDHRDGVAWHGDRIAHHVLEPVVAIVSLGAARPFQLRPRGGGPSRTIVPQGGDLVVMGGRSQHDWEHRVPKLAATTGPRISLNLRHSQSRGGNRRPATR